MTDTQTYVRVDWVSTYTDGEVAKVEVEGRQLVVPLDHVIELTEVRQEFLGQNADGSLNATKDFVETRLVSEWVVKR